MFKDKSRQLTAVQDNYISFRLEYKQKLKAKMVLNSKHIYINNKV